ncbi:MAG: 50S ribosomal protein L2 [Candidatus Ryanbacteria bacterium]|nr:50S ribosomal protein L2 [Candidatus Ryanbacteria bacterium]
MSVIEYRKFITKKDPEKALTSGFKRHVGRGSHGRITVRHKGGGVKRRYRFVSFSYDKKEIPARVIAIEYDPNRTAFLALLQYRDGEKRYVLASRGMHPGGAVLYSKDAQIQEGNAMPLARLVPGTPVYNIELKPGSGAKLVRSAGVNAEILAHEGEYSMLKMPSKEIRRVPKDAWGTIGSLSNEEHMFVTIGKAGRSRWLGIRPTVRGSAMNPVDHPYGGGEGRQPRGTRRPKNKWGKGTRGVKTRRKKKYSNIYIIERRPKKK